MHDLRNWLDATLPRISGRSDLAKAIRYSLSRWNALTLILRDGRACIDNSAAERAIRPIAIGRRNGTFAGSNAGDERAAAIYSLVETQSSTAWIQRRICDTCSVALQMTRSAVSPTSCRGIRPAFTRASISEPPHSQAPRFRTDAYPV